MSDQTQKLSAAPAAKHQRSPAELKRIIAAERAGVPFLVWRDVAGDQQILDLGELNRATIGRRASSTVVLADDDQVSRTHAELQRVGEDWTVTDDGLSRNGTFLNGARITGRKRLTEGDVIRLGKTTIEYRCPDEGSAVATASGTFVPMVESLTPTQHKVLIALCRPYRYGGEYPTPASNNEIAAEVYLGVDAVKNHLRLLFQRFDLSDLPQNQKRARLAERAFQWGLVADRDF